MSKIEWTDVTWNPIRRVGGGHACEKVSPGCKFCYAERMQPRFGNGPGKYDGKGEIYLDERVLEHPLRWKKPRMVFVCSMTDLFWEKVPDEWIANILAIMRRSPSHTFQVLTKRPERMHRIADLCDLSHERWKHVWLGVSAENQKYWDERVPWLVKTPAVVRFVSCEPLLGEIDICYPKTIWPDGPQMCCDGSMCGCMGLPVDPPMHYGIHWIIAGGESGPKARPSHPDWFRSLRDQCRAAGVKFFFKQWGDRIPFEREPSPPNQPRWWKSQRGDFLSQNTIERFSSKQGVWDLDALPGIITRSVKKKWAGRLLDGREWSEFPVASEQKC